jgi:hypothetical protein
MAAQLALGDRATYRAASYGVDVETIIPDEDIRDKKIGMFDFSFSREVLQRMRTTARYVVVVDHHKSGRWILVGGNQNCDGCWECGGCVGDIGMNCGFASLNINFTKSYRS